MVHVNRADMDSIGFETGLQFSFRRDEYPTVWEKVVNQLLSDVRIDTLDTRIMMCLQFRKANQKIGSIDREILLHDGLVRREIVWMEVRKFVVTVVFHGLVIPLSVVADNRRENLVSPRITELGVFGDDISIVFVDIDNGDVPEFANPGILHAGTSQDVRFELRAERIQAPGSFQRSPKDAPFRIFSAFFQYIVIRNACIFEQFL